MLSFINKAHFVLIRETMNNTPCEATQRDMAAKLNRLIEKVVIQWHLMAESCNICSSLPYRSLGELDTPLYECIHSD
jgi:hypothetical protein